MSSFDRQKISDKDEMIIQLRKWRLKYERLIWNEAIEAAASEAEKDHGSYCEEVGNEIRKLKK